RTTNGFLPSNATAALHAAGLQRSTVSLDTLRPERMLAFAKSPRHADVLEGIAAARKAGFAKLKLNAVVIRGFNDDELADLVEFARTHDAEVRFIEYMDVGGATRWSMEQVVSQREMLEVLARRYGAIEPIAADGRAPAERFRLADGTSFGIIASTTAPFCRACHRSRLTAAGPPSSPQDPCSTRPPSSPPATSAPPPPNASPNRSSPGASSSST